VTVTQNPGVDLHYSASLVWDYFNNVHGWKGLDDNGGLQNGSAADGGSCILLGGNWLLSNNAAWSGSNLRFGNGGASYNPFTKMDIVGHEWTHAITESTANLTYAGESGALNESISDVFGELVEGYSTGSYDWLVAELLVVSDTGPLRNMLNPAAEGQPDHYTERDVNGDVHINSGIPNRAFTLLANGSLHSDGGTMTGIGVGPARDIWWLALTDGQYLLSGSSFADARRATLAAAEQLYGNPSDEYTGVGNAWDLVGVWEVPGDITTYVSTSAGLDNPSGITVDSSGNLYIADMNHHKVVKVTIAGTVSTFAGTGTSGYSGDGGQATSATLSYPKCTAIDGNLLYISDMGNNVIRKVGISSGSISTFAGTGTAGTSGDGGYASSATLDHPNQIVFDPDADNLYVVDSWSNRIRRIDMSDDKIYAFAGTGTAGFSGDGSAATLAKLDSPLGVVATGTDVYFADTGNGRIRKVDSSSNISTFSSGLNTPYQLALSEADGLLYVPDYFNNRVYQIELSSGTRTTFAGTGSAGYSGDHGAATSATFRYPVAVAVDETGNVYIADSDNDVIRKVFH
jgi:sugar lactone lactonase YvrE